MTDQETTKTHKRRITDMAEVDRPRERLARLGADKLLKEELLAILLRTGVQGMNAVELAGHLLKEYNGVTGLHRAPLEEISSQKGIGYAKAAQIKAALELGHRMAEESFSKTAIHSPADAVDYVRFHMSALEQEELRVILLDTRNQIIGSKTIYQGSLNSSQVRVAELFRHAIRMNATAIIVVHNHPSGDPSPSPEDIAVTRAITQAGKLLDINILDHLVIGAQEFVSLKEKGVGFG